MEFIKSFKNLSKFELILWTISLTVVTSSFLLVSNKDYLSLSASLIGVTALIFVSKGYVLGQILTVIFSLFYGVISFFFSYYGEMITYLFMTSPMAILSAIEWYKNPYKKTKEVEVNRVTKKQMFVMLIFTAMVTFIFYFILKSLGNANLFFSTLSITTSFIASYLTYLRSPYYALAYSLNDIVLIILWILASVENVAYVPMIFCFLMFFANDIYGFYNWKRMMIKQSRENGLQK